MTAKAVACAHCQAALTEADQVLHGRYDKIDLPPVRPVVTRVERYAGHCPCCGGVTLAPVPEGLEDGSPFSVNIVALAIYLRFTHAISYRRLTPAVPAPLCAADQRGRAGCDVAACQALFRHRGCGHPRPAAPFADRLLR